MSCVRLWNTNIYSQFDFEDALEKYDIKTLEQLALILYHTGISREGWSCIPLDHILQILDEVLSERRIKLNENFVWTDEHVEEIVKASELLAFSSEKACMYAKSLQNELAAQENNNDFLMDYEIEIKLCPYLKGYEDNEDNWGDCFMYVLCEPIIKRHKNVLTCRYDDDKYFDRSESWNTDENFRPLDCFKDKYISYAIHELRDETWWSFQDIISIDRVCAEVKVLHQSFLGDYSKYE